MKVCRLLGSRHSAAVARLALVASGLSCVERSDDLGATGSETHFLLECSESCGAGLECIAGVCTSPCTGDEGCAIWSAAAVCSAEPATPELRVCDVQCAAAGDCAGLGIGYRCQEGSCRSAALASAETAERATGDLPAFEVLELRRLLETEPAAGSDCDPREISGAYFVDLPARQVSWMYCDDEARSRIYRRSTGQWPLADADREALLDAFAQLRVGASDMCYEFGGGFLDVTTAGSERFSYGDDALGGCPVAQRGRIPITDLSDFYSTLAPLFYDRPRGLPRETSGER